MLIHRLQTVEYSGLQISPIFLHPTTTTILKRRTYNNKHKELARLTRLYTACFQKLVFFLGEITPASKRRLQKRLRQQKKPKLVLRLPKRPNLILHPPKKPKLILRLPYIVKKNAFTKKLSRFILHPHKLPKRSGRKMRPTAVICWFF